MNEYPKMVYKSKTDYKVVQNIDEEEKVLKDGYGAYEINVLGRKPEGFGLSIIGGTTSSGFLDLEKLTEQDEKHEKACQEYSEVLNDLDLELKYHKETKGLPKRKGVETAKFKAWKEENGYS
jgi:hypothetical protein